VPLTTQVLGAQDALRTLFARGCGAMVDHGGCNLRTKPVLVVCNQSMGFLLWRSTMNPDGTCWCFLCGRHDGSVDSVMQDMSANQRRTQMAESKKWFAHADLPWVPPGVVALVDVQSLLHPSTAHAEEQDA